MATLVNNLALLVLGALICNTYQARIDPKLDFDEMARVVEVRDGNSKELRPIIRGVRVTVEAMADKASPESKSSESSDSNSSDRSSVGVRTDVTFEISNESNETKSDEDMGLSKNSTRTDKNKKDKDDGKEVPVIKGRPTPPKSPESNDITTWRPQVRPLYHSDSRESRVPENWFHNFPRAGVWTTERSDYRYGGYEIFPQQGKWILICCSWKKK